MAGNKGEVMALRAKAAAAGASAAGINIENITGSARTTVTAVVTHEISMDYTPEELAEAGGLAVVIETAKWIAGKYGTKVNENVEVTVA